MKVYRYLSEKELNSILAGDLSNIGCEYTRDAETKRINNHKYKKGIKYLHFFKNKKDIRRVRSLHETSSLEYYTAEFDIPLATLLFNKGIGKYDSSGYNSAYDEVSEFAVPASKIKSDYLRSFERDEVHHSSVEEVKSLFNMLNKTKDIFKNSSLPELKKQKSSNKNSSQNEDEPFQPS